MPYTSSYSKIMRHNQPMFSYRHLFRFCINKRVVEQANANPKHASYINNKFSTFADIPELIVYRTRKPDLQVDTIYFTQCSTSWSRRADTSWTLLKMILLYGVPLLFMSATYCQIVRVLWRSGCGHQPIGMDLSYEHI